MQHRPTTRAECVNGTRPCPYLACKYHMISAYSHRQMYHKNDEEILEFAMALPWTCVLDYVEVHPDGCTLQDIADILIMTRERARQLLDFKNAPPNKYPGILKKIKRNPAKRRELEEFFDDKLKPWEGRKHHAVVSEVHG